MSIALVYDTQKEIRRLLIAGSDLAAGDFRLQKLVPKLKQSGEKAPIFTRVAQVIEKVVEPEPGKAAENLLELANLVNAILYTQGEAGMAGEIRNIDTAEVSCPTNASYRKIAPVIKALTTKGSGRFEVIRTADETNVFCDLRLINPLITALGDGYSEIPELVFKLLQGYGTAIIPVLKKRLNLNGDKVDARIMELLASLLGESGKELYLTALEKGSIPVQVSAIKVLKDIPECENIIMDLVDHNKKEIREAAIDALGYFLSDAVATKLFQVFTGKDRQVSIAPIRRNETKLLVTLLHAEAEKTLQEILQAESPGQTAPGAAKDDPLQVVVDYLFDIIRCLMVNIDPEVADFLLKCLKHIGYLAKIKSTYHYSEYERLYGSQPTLARYAALGLRVQGKTETYDFLVEQEGKNNNHLLGFSFQAALLSRSPEYVFKRYAKYLSNKKKNPFYQDILHVMNYYFVKEPGKKTTLSLHADWIKVLVANDETELVCAVIPEGSSKGIDYLHYRLKKTGESDYWANKMIIEGLLKAKDKKISEAIEQKLKSLLDVKSHRTYYIRSFLELAKPIGPGLIKSLEKLAAGCNEEIQGILLTTANELKSEEKK